MGVKKTAFQGSNGGTVWLDPVDVECVKSIDTKYGARLLVTFKGSGREQWLEDDAKARKELGLC